MSFVVSLLANNGRKASAMALQEIPAINAVIDTATNEIVYRNYCDISVAVASPNGLVVPVLRNTEKMGFAVSLICRCRCVLRQTSRSGCVSR